MSAPSLNRWTNAVQYRHVCDGCQEHTLVAVIKRRERDPLRLCRTCFLDGFWRRWP